MIYLFVTFHSLGASSSGQTQTLNLAMRMRVFYHCATYAGQQSFLSLRGHLIMLLYITFLIRNHNFIRQIFVRNFVKYRPFRGMERIWFLKIFFSLTQISFLFLFLLKVLINPKNKTSSLVRKCQTRVNMAAEVNALVQNKLVRLSQPHFLGLI